MAGCKPEYLPVVVAAVEASCTAKIQHPRGDRHDLRRTPVIVVNGSIRHQRGMNMAINVFGRGNRPNATTGRAVKLLVRNVGGGRPGEVERACFGSGSKCTCCFAEFEEKSRWEPLHVKRGFDSDDSVVTCFGLEGGPHQIRDATDEEIRVKADKIVEPVVAALVC